MTCFYSYYYYYFLPFALQHVQLSVPVTTTMSDLIVQALMCQLSHPHAIQQEDFPRAVLLKQKPITPTTSCVFDINDAIDPAKCGRLTLVDFPTLLSVHIHLLCPEGPLPKELPGAHMRLVKRGMSVCEAHSKHKQFQSVDSVNANKKQTTAGMHVYMERRWRVGSWRGGRERLSCQKRDNPLLLALVGSPPSMPTTMPSTTTTNQLSNTSTFPTGMFNRVQRRMRPVVLWRSGRTLSLETSHSHDSLRFLGSCPYPLVHHTNRRGCSLSSARMPPPRK